MISALNIIYMKIIKTNIDNLLPIKINVSEKNWIKIQENLFSIGCEWSASGKSVLRSYQKKYFCKPKQTYYV